MGERADDRGRRAERRRHHHRLLRHLLRQRALRPQALLLPRTPGEREDFGLFIERKHFHEWCSFSSSLIYLNLSQFEYQINETLSLGPHDYDEYHFLGHSSTLDTQIG